VTAHVVDEARTSATARVSTEPPWGRSAVGTLVERTTRLVLSSTSLMDARRRR